MDERGAWRLLLALAALNVLGYVDRQLVAALAPVLMAELGLTRADVGLLIGPVFVVVFAVGALFLGAAADRGRRPRIMAGGLAVWSASTALTGTGSGFATLAFWRALVGVGEASLPPTAVSMLGDRFPPSRLGFATSVYYAGVPVGFACSLALAGWLVPRFGWRSCFYLLGVLGLAAVALVWRMEDPRRHGAPRGRPSRGFRVAGRSRAGCAARLRPSPRSVSSSRARRSSCTRARPRSTSSPGWCRSAASTSRGRRISPRRWSSGRGSPAVSPWAVSPTRRSVDRTGGRLYAFIGLGAASLAATTAFYLLPVASPFFLAAWLVAQAWTLGWFGPMLAAIHDRAPAGSRGMVVGFSLMTVNLLGVGLGPWITGAIGDRAGLTAGFLTSVAVGAVGLAVVGLAALREGRRAGAGGFLVARQDWLLGMTGAELSFRGTSIGRVPRNPQSRAGGRRRRIPRRPANAEAPRNDRAAKFLGVTTLRIVG